MNYLEEAFAPVEAYNKAVVMNATWGHLAPLANVKYVGQIVFCQSETGECVPISSYFANPETGESLPGSPWFQNDIEEFVGKKATDRGRIYKFSGCYWRNKTGRSHFSGRIEKCVATPEERHE